MIPGKLSAEDDSFDVVVAGAGVAGMSAALFTAILGLKPLLIERTDRLGGTSAYSAGRPGYQTHITPLRSGPTDDSIEKAALYLQHSVGNESPEPLRMAFLPHGPEAVALLEQNSQVRFRARKPHPDDNSSLPGATLSPARP
jgi:succinate dehydrogenase/fumarate reductase flavoprotein subunit